MVDYDGYVKNRWCSWRDGHGATVHTIAQYAGVTDSTVRRWDDRRDTALPDTVAVIRIALGVGMSPGALVDRLAYGLPRPSAMPMPTRW